jgi:polysaccharide pyruvyl transferase WcaK-like protein
VKIAAELSGRGDVKFFPDAAYLLKAGTTEQTHTVAIIPAGVVNAHDLFIQHFLRLFDSVNLGQVWISMGSEFDDGKHMADAVKLNPRATLVRRPSPREALDRIASAKFVLSGRYHGMVFARSSGVPFFTPQDAPYKILGEDLHADPAAATGHIEALREVIASH